MLVVCITTQIVFGQEHFSGVVLDTAGYPIKDVNVRLYTPKDTLFAITNGRGIYSFTLPRETYTIHLGFSILGYAYEEFFFTRKDLINNKLPNVILSRAAFIIENVTVTKVIPIVVNGDTIQYNMGAFTFGKHALLEDGLKKLPGFQVLRDGSVYFNGTHIRRVRVNNNDFFGGDVLTATKNLPVDYINNIQLIEVRNENDATDNGIVDNQATEKILNINLKEDRKIFHFGQLTFGAGTNQRYLGSFGINRFDDGNEISILGSINNTNTNLFSFGDIMGGSRNTKSFDIDEYIDPTDGINTTYSIGTNWVKKINSRTRLSGAYNFIHKNSQVTGFSNMKSAYTGNTITKTEDFDIIQNDYNHNLRFLLDKKFENEDLLKIEGNFTLHNKSYMNERKTELSNSFLQNKGNNTDSTKQVLPMGNVEMTFVKNFENKNRKFVGKMGLRAHKLTDREYVDEEYTVAYQMSLDTVMELNHQFVDMKNYNDSKNLMMSYVEPFLNNGLFEFKYEFEHNRIDASRYTYNWINNQPRGIIDSLTVDYGYQYFTNKMGITYQYNLPKKLKFNIGFAVQPIKMLGEILNDTLTYSYDNINLVPTSNLTYKISNNLDFQLSYKGKNNEPSFFQIAPVRNNTNSRNIIIGNPELKSEFTHSFLSTVRAFFPVRMQYLETSFIFNKVKDKIVNDKKPLENTTIQQTTFRNTNGYYDWKLNYIFNTPLGGDSWQLNLDGSVNYFNNLSFIEDRKRTTKQFLFQQALKLKYSLDEYVESSLNAVYSQNYARYDIPFRTRINVQSLFLGLGIKGYVKDNFSMGVEMSQRNNDGYFNNFMNVNQTLMNAFIEYSFLQNRTAMLRIHAYDLFDQNANMGIYSEYIGNDLYEERKSRLGRYIMLALNIRLQK